MIRPPLADVLGALVEVGRPILRREFHERCCVAGTRLTVSVLESAGYRAYPTAFWVRAGNRAFCEAVMSGEDWSANRDARFVEVGGADTVPNPEGYPAHLCTVVAGTLVDLTAEQLNRPRKRIHVPDWVCLDLPHDWADGRTNTGKHLEGGGILVYRKHPAPPEYRAAPDWAVERTMEAAAEVKVALGLFPKAGKGIPNHFVNAREDPL